MSTIEQQVREMLGRIGIDGDQFTAGDLVEFANLLNDSKKVEKLDRVKPAHFVEHFTEYGKFNVQLSLLFSTWDEAFEDKKLRLKQGLNPGHLMEVSSYTEDEFAKLLLSIVASAVVADVHDTFFEHMDKLKEFVKKAVADFDLAKQILQFRSAPGEINDLFKKVIL